MDINKYRYVVLNVSQISMKICEVIGCVDCRIHKIEHKLTEIHALFEEYLQVARMLVMWE